jgi:hypothetical protein
MNGITPKNKMADDEDNVEQNTAFIRAQAITGGILSALTKYLPHLIGACGVALSGVLFTVNHAKEQQDTKTIWQHSGEWHSNYVAVVDSISNLEVQMLATSNRLEKVIQNQKPKQ